MKVNEQKLAEIAGLLMVEASGNATDNEICIGNFRDRHGKPCTLNLTITPTHKHREALPVFNCLEG